MPPGDAAAGNTPRDHFRYSCTRRQNHAQDDHPQARRRERRRILEASLIGQTGVAGADRYGRASKMRLKGVWVAPRKRVKPPLVTTSRKRFSPAWAPSAAPTS